MPEQREDKERHHESPRKRSADTSNEKMATQSQGIKQLMAAEKEAAQVVANARKRKTQRLKEAKEEAAKEIEEYRKDRERHFQDQQQKFAGSKDDFTQKIREESQEKLVKIECDVKDNKEQVIQRLLELVYDIQPELHRNAKNV